MMVSFSIALGLRTGCDDFRSPFSLFATSFFFAEGVAFKSRLACLTHHPPLTFVYMYPGYAHVCVCVSSIDGRF